MSTRECFDKQCDKVGKFLDKHPLLYKITLVISHIFRAVMMFALMHLIPLSPLLTCGLMLIPTLLYRSAIERFCAFRFSLPSLAGGLAIWAARATLVSIIAGVAFSSLAATCWTILGPLSLAGYLAFICYISHKDVEKRLEDLSKEKPCCS